MSNAPDSVLANPKCSTERSLRFSIKKAQTNFSHFFCSKLGRPVALTDWSPTSIHLILLVVELCSNVQVVRVHTRRIVTSVQYPLSTKKRTVHQLEHYLRCFAFPAA